ncbi:FkbM family methyltransferase [Actinomycetospora chibensis]|uniref:FkbM family methyltransferase n=1 Tax=Actinomycetospora chibensis TaxID=663606 RepID=A0ABV9RPR6_9PSEU|nr:FkbM family methyltransferase [Actinomycetospora chibensis]MDD7927210.1 FkbM family methyltransferase [Actinomycetospora chibensis]
MSIRWKLEILRMRIMKVGRLATRPAYWSDLRRGVFPGLEHLQVPFLSHYDYVVDAGASRGQFASFAKNQWPHSRLFCFEPQPKCAATARAVVGGRGEVHEVALSNEEGIEEFIVSGREDSSSLLPVGELAEQVANAGEVGRFSVPVHRLDRHTAEFGAGTGLLKIDVQGLELEVLKGLGEQIRGFADIYLECSFRHLYEGQALGTEIIAYLSSRGFQLIAIENPARGESHEILQADLLFRRGDQRGDDSGAFAARPSVVHEKMSE